MSDFHVEPVEVYAGSPRLSGVAARDLGVPDLLRELETLHMTRYETLRHGSDQALDEHSRRTAELEAEYLVQFPDREVDPLRTRGGARAGTPDVRTGADQQWDPQDLAVAEGRDPTPDNVERARQELADDGPAAIERTVP